MQLQWTISHKKKGRIFHGKNPEHEIKTSAFQSRLWYFCSVTFKAFRVLLINVILPRHYSNLINHPNVHIFRCHLLTSQIITEVSAHSYVMFPHLGLTTRTRRILRSGYSGLVQFLIVTVGVKIVLNRLSLQCFRSGLLLLGAGCASVLLMRHKHQNSSTD